jgi:hypothetical protein
MLRTIEYMYKYAILFIYIYITEFNFFDQSDNQSTIVDMYVQPDLTFAQTVNKPTHSLY